MMTFLIPYIKFDVTSIPLNFGFDYVQYIYLLYNVTYGRHLFLTSK